jgi:hypothetical protein
VIISHKWGFIFIKTRKTAGSSIEAALSQLLGPDDTATGSERDGTPRQTYEPGMTGHMPWHRVSKIAGKENFRRYKKFCVERNCYDKAVSAWLYHRTILRSTDRSFREFLRKHNLSDWARYTKGDEPVCQVIQFDDLQKGLNCQADWIGFPRIDLAGYRLKVNPDRRPTEYYYDEATFRLVTRMFQNEIKAFGYTL